MTTGKAWICTVCGYIHRGDEPPECCPICGAARSDFEIYTAPAPMAVSPVIAAHSVTHTWRCLICGYEETAEMPPEVCPVCTALADKFESIETSTAPAIRSQQRLRIAVIGAGIAGVSAATAARETAPNAEIVLFSKEPGLPYYRLNLTRYVAGDIDSSALPIHPAAWYDNQRIALMVDTEVDAIDARVLTVRYGNRDHAFDRIVITCGAHPFIPPISGTALKNGVTVLRTVQDADRLIETAKTGASIVCIGGGVLGLEAAAGFARRGAAVTVLESYEWLLPRQLNREAARILNDYVAAQGIHIIPSAQVTAITGDNQVRQVDLANGLSLPADAVVIAAGIRPNSWIARQGNIQVNQGILVDNYLATSYPGIYAAGDVAEYQGTVYGLWEPARFQGAIAGTNAAGGRVEFGGLPRTNTLKVVGIDLFSAGIVQPPDGSYSIIAQEEDGNSHYRRFVFHDNHLVGAIIIGETGLSAATSRAIKMQTDFSALLAMHPSAAQVAETLATV